MPEPTRPSWLRSRIRIVLGLLVIAAVATAVLLSRFRAVPVVATPVVRGTAVDAVYATGTVEAEERVQVKAKSSGSVAEVLVREGTVVKKGDLLARIDNPNVAFELKRGQADLSAASAQAGSNAPRIAALVAHEQGLAAELATAKQDLGRVEKLQAGGAVAQSEVDKARTRVLQLEASIAAGQAEQRATRIDLTANAAQKAAQVQSLATRVTDTEVRSPLEGVVLSKSVEVGEVVSVNQTLFKVGDIRSLVLEVSVDEADVARVRVGPSQPSVAAVSLYAFPKRVFRATVFDLFPDANRERKAFLVKVRLEQPPEGLRSGMSAEVNIIAEERVGSLLAPSESEVEGAVWVISGGQAHRRPVQIGVRDLLRFEILGGLEEGELVVVDGQDKLTEGKRVAPTVREADKAAPVPDKSQPVRSTL